jgi:hypothetical protein
MQKIGTIGPYGIVPDDRSVTNSGVGLMELPTVSTGSQGMTNLTPSGKQAAFGAAMIQGHPGRERSTKLSENWLNDPRFGVK